ncbi:hypothetical protein M3Y95_00558100 [Aphelenchoides besseyi]|nr:hypothetical protein M3Y95_00558100 [Aphelenchoides besseyi]
MTTRSVAGVFSEKNEQNWPGKCDELCSQRKITCRPEYTFTEEGPPNQKTFVCTSKLRDIEVQESGPSKKKAKAAAAEKMHQKISELRDPFVFTDRNTTQMLEIQTFENHHDLPAVQHESSISTSNSEIQNLLSNRSIHDHCGIHKCVGSEKLLRQLQNCSAMDKWWPNRKLVFLLDNTNLIELDGRNMAELQSQYNNSTTFDDIRVFLEIRDAKTNRLVNFFLGIALSISEARELASCRAVSFAQAKMNSHRKST